MGAHAARLRPMHAPRLEPGPTQTATLPSLSCRSVKELRTQLEGPVEGGGLSWGDIPFDWGFSWESLPYLDSEFYGDAALRRFESAVPCMKEGDAAGCVCFAASKRRPAA